MKCRIAIGMHSRYEQGHCFPQNNFVAYLMYDLAGAAASDIKQALVQKMAAAEFDEATWRSRDWQNEHHRCRLKYDGDTHIHWNMH